MFKWLKAAREGVFPARLRALEVILLTFLAFNALVRVGLAIYGGDASVFWPWRIVPAMLIGLLFDVGVATFFLGPLAIVALLLPRRWPRLALALMGLVLLPLALVLAFVGASEFTFWNEFSSRFNFIAVDYLIYTNEVMGNLRESYNLPLMLSGVCAVALAVWGLVLWRIRLPLQQARPEARRAWLAIGVWLISPIIAVGALDARYKEFSSDAQLNELAGNGYYDFWHAFWANAIDYERFYKVLPHDQAVAGLASALAAHRTPVTLTDRPFDRDVQGQGPEKPLNVVLVSVESLSAEFMPSFGNREGLTPNLDRLARDGLFFTHLYATGTRTVRGLEALTLSIPPTPGHAIVKRPHNDHLFSLGSVFKQKGYEPLYIYGGYGYFDNMNAFFSDNGYTVVDRTSLKPEDIHFENIWGVADEDLFTLTLRELDKRHASGTKFFAHVMTTSNHRPFTYPEGRIDIPSKTSREGAVKYTDWAIGNFIDRARSKPWFDDTVFVIVADHTHKGRGQQELPILNYHIPMLVYAPKHVTRGRVDTIASQIDVAPTILGLLNFSYHSKFFGQDILRDGPLFERAMMANYQTVGYYEAGRIVELKPHARAEVVDATSGQPAPNDALSERLRNTAISYYQIAAEAYRLGQLKSP